MTLKTSWFNFGLFKANIKRFKWGSVLYFLLLFLTVCLPLITMEYNALFYSDNALMDISWFALAMTWVVPTVTALLVFMGIHKKKSAVFTYGLPLKREGLYLTNVISGLCLMFVPVLLTTLILVCIAPATGGVTVLHCLEWMLLQLYSLTLNYSLAVLAATLAGTTFSMLAINAILQFLPVILVFGLDTLFESMIFGYSGSSDMYTWIANCNYVVASIKVFTMLQYDSPYEIGALGISVYFATSLLFYVAGGFLHHFRKSENAGEMMAFSKTRFMFKGVVTAFGLIIANAITVNAGANLVTAVVVLGIVSGILYFGTEMVLSHTIKIKGAVKGYLLFVGSIALLAVVFSATHFFGYETYVPDASDIQSATIYEEWAYEEGKEPLLSDKASIELIRKCHTACIREGENSRFYENKMIVYTLKNGKRVSRCYMIYDFTEADRIYDHLKESKAYREADFYATMPKKEAVTAVYTDCGVGVKPEEYDKLYSLLLADFIEKGNPAHSAYSKVSVRLSIEFKGKDGVPSNRFFDLTAENAPNTVNFLIEIGCFE